MSFTTDDTAAPRWSDVYISASARAVSSCGDMLAATALLLVLQARDLSHSGLVVSALLLAATVPPILLTRVAGRIADRFDSRHIVVTIGLAQVVACTALAYVTSFWAIIALVAVLAAGLAVTSPTLSALTPAMVGRDNLAKAGGIGQTASSIGMLIAPVLGGVLVGAYGSRTPLLIDAATYLVIPIAGLVLRTRRRGGVANTETIRVVDPAAAPAWSIGRDPLIRPLLILFAAVVGAISAIDVVEVFFIRQTLHSSPTMYGLIAAMWLVGILVGAAFFGRRNPDDAQLARWMLGLLTGTVIVAGVAGTVPGAIWLVPLWIVGGITNGGENVAFGVLLGRRAPSATRGHANAVAMGAMNAAIAVGYVAAGLLLSVAGTREIILGTSILALALTGVFAGPLLRAAATERKAQAVTRVEVTAVEPVVA
jgi:MFS family permease